MAEPGGGGRFLYVGTFTAHQLLGRGNAEGIYVFKVDSTTGALTLAHVHPEAINPSFLALAPDGRHLYSVNAVAEIDGQAGGAISAFARDAQTGALTYLNRQPSHGAGPCHVNVERTGRTVLAANYGGGSIAALPILADGQLGPAATAIQHVGGSNAVPDRQAGPHAHSINLDPAQRFVLVCDLGLDRVLIYRLEAATARLTPNEAQPWVALEPGSGPRHLDFHPSGRFVYVINEIASTLTAFAYDGERGVLSAIHTLSTLPEGGHAGNSTADVHVHPNGKFVYGSNRGHDSIAIYAIDEATGRLTHLGNESTRGRTPRNFMIEPNGARMLVANQDSGDIQAFRIDQSTGGLDYQGKLAEVPSPVCLKLV